MIILLCMGIIFGRFEFAKLQICQRNYSDLDIPEKHEEYYKGKGHFTSNCPLLKPNTTIASEYEYYLFGSKLTRSACIAASYTKEKVPNTYIELEEDQSENDVIDKGGIITKNKRYLRLAPRKFFFLPYTTIYTKIKEYDVREIDEKKQIITLDMSLTLQWMDPFIFTYTPRQGTTLDTLTEIEGYDISKEASKRIWKPDLPVHNLYDYKSYIDSFHMRSLKIFRINRLYNNVCITGPFLQYDIEAKFSFYCKFDLSNFPMDSSHCKLRFGGEVSNMAFKLDKRAHGTKNTSIVLISDMTTHTTIVEDTADIDTKTEIGLDIHIERALRPYVLKYYIPCITIVIISQISFIIPLDALPGRVALGVTQFLTLMSLFIQQMNDSPTGSNIDKLGVYLLVSLFFVVATMVEFAVALLIKRSTRNVKITKQLGSKSTLGVKTSSEELNSSKVAMENKKIAIGDGSFQKALSNCKAKFPLNNLILDRKMSKPSDNECFDLVETTCSLPKISSNAIDIMSSILFPLSYMIFNVIYWSLLM